MLCVSSWWPDGFGDTLQPGVKVLFDLTGECYHVDDARAGEIDALANGPSDFGKVDHTADDPAMGWFEQRIVKGPIGSRICAYEGILAVVICISA